MKRGDIAKAIHEELQNTELNPVRNTKMRISADVNGFFRLSAEQIIKKLNFAEISEREAIKQLLSLDGQTKNALEYAHDIIDVISENPNTISGIKTKDYLLSKYGTCDWEELNMLVYVNLIGGGNPIPLKENDRKEIDKDSESDTDNEDSKSDTDDNDSESDTDNEDSKSDTDDNDSESDTEYQGPTIIIQSKKTKGKLDVLLKELDAIVGLTKVKQSVKNQLSRIKMNEIRIRKGLPPLEDLSLHMVFLGNPGTGKTTVASIVGKIYGAMGLLSKGHLTIAQRVDLVGQYIGQTAIKTNKMIEKALGGILFIDEAYSLSPEVVQNDYGQEAIATLITAMENNRDDFVVIVAGYPEEMKRFLLSNPGLKSRFGMTISFDDYNGTEIFEIFSSMITKDHLILSEDAAEIVKKYFNDKYENRDNDSEPFSNGRFARNVRDKLVMILTTRIANSERMDEMTPEELSLITGPDVEEAIRLMEAEKI